MKRAFSLNSFILSILLLSGCSSVGSKTASMSVIYGITAVFSLLLLIGYCVFIKKKDIWFLFLFISVFIVNTGYYSLAVSKNLEEALLANRISYFGSAFLPLSMLMAIFNLTKLNYKKWIPAVLLTVTICVFLIAATPGYLDIYYKSVSLEQINGMSCLKKEYGPWHLVYLYYLLTYFALMIATTLHAVFKKKLNSGIETAIILIAVFVNICVWLLEQLVDINFEILSVSYIISELFLIALYLIIQENENKKLVQTETETPAVTTENNQKITDDYLEKCKYLKEHIEDLTATEKLIFNSYVQGKSTKEILEELNISENTLKFHNKNLYGKLGVTSRKQIKEYMKALKTIE